MRALDLLANLLPYQSLLKRLLAHEQDHLSANPTYARPSWVLRNQHDLITLYLSYISEEEGPLRPIVNPHCEIRFNISSSTPRIESLHCEAKARTAALAALVEAHVAAPRNAWNPTVGATHHHSDAVTRYLAIADAIASPVRHCASGDDYRPGNFSEVFVDEDFIVLSQINHMNAKSLARTSDYSLRNLVFTIPLGDYRTKPSFDDTVIGEMLVRFSDRSSDNNRACGNGIAERIAQAKQAFTP